MTICVHCLEPFSRADDDGSAIDCGACVKVNRDAEIPEGDYYVTVRDSGRRKVGYLLGPYRDYLECLANIRRGRLLVNKYNADPFAEHLYGHSRLPIGTACRTVFNLEGEVNR